MNVGITLDRAAIEPGGTISGSVTWQGPAGSVVVGLRWVTRGKGDVDEDKVTSTTIPNTVDQTEARFALTAPFQPFTFSGKLVSVLYYVTVTIDGREWAKTEIVIAPGGKEAILAGT